MIGAFVAAGLLAVAAPTPPSPPAPPVTPAVVAGSLSLFGGDYTIPANETRQGNVTVYGGDIDVQGRISHDLRVFGGDVTIEGTVGHDVQIFGGSVHLGARAEVGHDVAVLGGSLDRDPGARVGHEVVQGGFSTDLLAGMLPALPPLPSLSGPDTPLRVGLSAGFVLLALLLQLLFPRQIATTRDALDERPFATLGLGCLTAVAAVLLAALLAVTVILVPLSVAIGVATTAAWVLGLASLTVLLGERLTAMLHFRINAIPTLLIGGVLVAVLVNVPYLGIVFGLLIGSMALGAVVLTRFGTRAHPPALPPGVPATPPEAPR
jgi:hypothetical protein